MIKTQQSLFHFASPPNKSFFFFPDDRKSRSLQARETKITELKILVATNPQYCKASVSLAKQEDKMNISVLSIFCVVVGILPQTTNGSGKKKIHTQIFA